MRYVFVRPRYRIVYVHRRINGHQLDPEELYALHLEEAAVARDLALIQVDDAADEEWKEYAEDFMREWCRTHPDMFTDELWDHGLEEPRELRALGPRVLALKRQGIIEMTDESRPRTHGHCAYGPVWKSLIYRP